MSEIVRPFSQIVRSVSQSVSELTPEVGFGRGRVRSRWSARRSTLTKLKKGNGRYPWVMIEERRP